MRPLMTHRGSEQATRTAGPEPTGRPEIYLFPIEKAINGGNIPSGSQTWQLEIRCKCTVTTFKYADF